MAEPPVRLTVTDDLRRSRLTVFFRLFLAIPHFLWWTGWSFVALVAAVANWVVTLITGRPRIGSRWRPRGNGEIAPVARSR